MVWGGVPQYICYNLLVGGLANSLLHCNMLLTTKKKQVAQFLGIYAL